MVSTTKPHSGRSTTLSMYMHMYVHSRVNMYVHVYICVFMSMFVCVYLFLCDGENTSDQKFLLLQHS